MKAFLIGLSAAGVVLMVLLLPHSIASGPWPIDAAWVQHRIGQLGPVGPIALIVLMALAIVVSPIPSGPIALAAGALYGTVLGGSLSIIGALLGALLAFGSARYLGFDAVRRSSIPILRYLAAPRSQTALMFIVFVSRLMPFISFDLVSYAAGLTALSFWQFALATLLGIVPICLALAAMGEGLVGHAEIGTTTLMIVSGVTLVPLILRGAWHLLSVAKARLEMQAHDVPQIQNRKFQRRP